MAEPPIKYPLETSGGDKVVTTLSSIDKAFAQNVASTQKFDAAVQKAADRLTNAYTRRAAQALVKNRLGLDDNTRSANSLRSSLDRLAVVTHGHARATQMQAVATQAAVSASTRLAINVQRTLPTLSALGSSLSRVSPAMGALSTSIGAASGAMGGFTSVLGGPFGIAIGAATALVGVASVAYQALASDTEEVTRKTVEYNDTLDEQIEILQKLQREQSRRQQVSMGVADPLTMEAELRRLEAQANRFRDARREAADAGNVNIVRRYDAVLRRNEQQRRKAAEDLAFVRASDNQALLDEAAEEDVPAGRSRGGRGGGRRSDPNDPFLRNQRGQANRARIAVLDAQQSPAFSFDEDAVKAARQQSDALIDIERERFKQSIDLRREADQQMAEIDRQTMQRWDGMRMQGVSVFETFGSAGIKALQGLAKGQKITAKALLSAVGDELVGKGTVWLFEGIARGFSSYGLDPTATALIATGSGAIAAGIGMGAATSGGSAGASRGAGGNRTAAVPLAPSGETGGRTRPISITNNFNSTVPATEDQAVEISRMTRQGVRSGRLPRDWSSQA